MNRELMAIARRYADLEEQRAQIASEIADLKTEAESQGFDKAVLAKVVRIMRMDADKRKKALEQIELFDTYLAGVGLLPDEPPAKAEPSRTLTNPRHVVKPSEVQKIADRAASRSADPPREEEPHDVKAKPSGHQGGAALVAASSSEDDFDIPAYLDRRRETLRC